MNAGTCVPILRIFDEAAAKAFYVEFLGFKIDWEHRFDDDAPLYAQATLGDCVIHLSGHHGDACPGSAVRVYVADLDAFRDALLAKKYSHSRPGILDQSWGTRDMAISDPSGNRIIFWARPPGAGGS